MIQQKHTYISLGSNIGDRFSLLQKAMDKISEEIGVVTKISSVYQSPAWGFEGDDFLNAVILVKTKLTPSKLLKKLLEIEASLGRIRTGEKGYQSRPIDLDILFYEDEIISVKNLSIPHPQLHKRNFVLVPLHEIAPDYIHPVLRKTVAELFDESIDETGVSIYSL